MKEITELGGLMLELLDDDAIFADTGPVFKGRSREIIDEISDYAEQTPIFQREKERGETFNDGTAEQVFGYMLDRIANAPTTLHRDTSVILIMPHVRKKLREEEQRT